MAPTRWSLGLLAALSLGCPEPVAAPPPAAPRALDAKAVAAVRERLHLADKIRVLESNISELTGPARQRYQAELDRVTKRLDAAVTEAELTAAAADLDRLERSMAASR